MTKTLDVHKIPAGRELDALVAERVMGQQVSTSCLCCHGATCPRHDDSKIPQYSTVKADALEIVEKLKEDGCEIHLAIHRKPFLYWCTIYWGGKNWSDLAKKSNHSMRRKRYGNDDFKCWASYVETMPLAICRAALISAERRNKA
jgi:hypothetical protein